MDSNQKNIIFSRPCPQCDGTMILGDGNLWRCDGCGHEMMLDLNLIMAPIATFLYPYSQAAMAAKEEFEQGIKSLMTALEASGIADTLARLQDAPDPQEEARQRSRDDVARKRREMRGKRNSHWRKK